MLDNTGTEDCLIVGGGPAGLTAALYLARFGRRFVLADAGNSRAAWIPETHNFPVFAHGIGGKRMLQMMREHVASYAVTPLSGEITAIDPGPDGFQARFSGTDGAKRVLHARTVLLATGSIDCAPRMPALADAVREGLIRYCPICDGYEARGQNIAVMGQGEHGLAEALFMQRTYGGTVTLLTIGEELHLSREQREKAASHAIRLVTSPVDRLEKHDGCIAAICTGDGSRHVFATVYAALGLSVRTGLALRLGAEHDGNGALKVDAHNETSVRGLFAAGDAVAGLNQIVVAMGHAAIAATAIHNRCVSASS